MIPTLGTREYSLGYPLGAGRVLAYDLIEVGVRELL